MAKVSIWKKIGLYKTYRKLIIKNKTEFLEKYNLRVDRAKRIYTVVNIPPDLFDEAYAIRTSDINNISQTYLTEYIKQIRDLLDQKELKELYKLYNITKISKFGYLVVIGFSLFDTSLVLKKILFRFLPIILLISGLIFYFFFL